MRSTIVLFSIATVASGGAEPATRPDPSPVSPPALTAESPASPNPTATPLPNKTAGTEAQNTIENNGQVFALTNRTTGQNVETDEYVLAGEQLTDWTQLVTVQRLTLAQATPTSGFLAYFQKRIQAENGATLEVVRQSTTASVFVVSFPKSQYNDEQVMICLAFAEPSLPTRLNIVQYAVKPARVAKELAETQVRSWRTKFLAQADALKSE